MRYDMLTLRRVAMLI